VWYSGNPCNMHLLELNNLIKEGVEKAGLVGMQFNTIGVRYANMQLWLQNHGF
jgi:dihydroxy-acid dehydratase